MNKRLTSLDYADLIRWIAYSKFGVLLNKTQLNALLFMSYGLYLTMKGEELLFEDDLPKASPFGPYFHCANRHISFNNIPVRISSDKQTLFRDKQDALCLIYEVVRRYYNYSAWDLNDWTHREDGPWAITLFGKRGEKRPVKWNRPIDRCLIKSYFSHHEDM